MHPDSETGSLRKTGVVLSEEGNMDAGYANTRAVHSTVFKPLPIFWKFHSFF